MSQDPDRYDLSRDPAAGVPGGSAPYSADSPGDRTLPELLGEGAHEDDRGGLEWLAGLVGVVAFLALVAYLFAKVLEPS